MKITLGFSPCPNDTFIFDALVHGKIPTGGLEFEVVIADVEELNRMAFQHRLDVTKLSFHAYAWLTNSYLLLDSGSALGRGCGPLLIAKTHKSDEEIIASRIAIPGLYTTAHFLFKLAFPTAENKVEMLFSDIENAVLEGHVDAGLIIHENRFTYAQKGLVKILDLGEYWENATGEPIPLGGIVAKRSLPRNLLHQINDLVSQSVHFAIQYPQEPYAFMRQYAQEMDQKVMYEHIRLYVNDFTADLGGEGRTAVGRLFDIATARGIIPPVSKEIFLN